MNGYDTIDTDAGIGTILSHFSTEFINHIIEDSFNMRFRPFDTGMPNMVDVMRRQLVAVSGHTPDYIEKVKEVEDETYKEIINMIANYYQLSITADLDTYDTLTLYSLAHTMYDIFIARFTEYMIEFFVSFIIRNSDSIYTALISTDDFKRSKDVGTNKKCLDNKIGTIHANINTVVYSLAGYDIKLQDLLNYFLDPQTASFLGGILVDTGDIYKKHYASFILDSRYTAGILTNIKLKLQSRTYENMPINTTNN